jgi:hypothetical protein
MVGMKNKGTNKEGRACFEQRENHSVFPQHRIAVYKKAVFKPISLSGIALQRHLLI